MRPGLNSWAARVLCLQMYTSFYCLISVLRSLSLRLYTMKSIVSLTSGLKLAQLSSFLPIKIPSNELLTQLLKMYMFYL